MVQILDLLPLKVSLFGFEIKMKWDSAEGHLRGFRTGPDFAGFVAHVRPFMPAILEMRHYTPTSIKRSARDA